jgi:dTDP-4-dehydrorhamnose 3,5-epimerase
VIFRPLPIAGAFAVEPEPIVDERGCFARTASAAEFARHGCLGDFVEQSIAYNRAARTLRGMHYQRDPYPEGKLVRCTSGAVYDVLVDVRADSASFGMWHAERLDARNRVALYAPPGVAHGYLTREPDTELTYAMSSIYVPTASAGFRYDDASVAIAWPFAAAIVSTRDLGLPAFPG